MATAAQIKKHAKTKYASSPHTFTDQDIERIIKADCSCSLCGQSIFEMDDFPETNEEDYDVLCSDCYDREFMQLCEVCQEFYEPRHDTVHYLVFTPRQIDEFGLEVKPGIYRPKENPYYYGDVVFGFQGLFEENLELINECDMDSILSEKLKQSYQIQLADCICQTCAEKYGNINNK